jgi:hypothetical protein
MLSYQFQRYITNKKQADIEYRYCIVSDRARKDQWSRGMSNVWAWILLGRVNVHPGSLDCPSGQFSACELGHSFTFTASTVVHQAFMIRITNEHSGKKNSHRKATEISLQLHFSRPVSVPVDSIIILFPPILPLQYG